MPSGNALTIAQVLYIHDRVIETSGGHHGVRDLNGLAAAVAAPQAGIADRELYPTLLEQAAALVRSLIQNHPFVDGNKRTGVAAAGLFLEDHGWELIATNEELEEFAVWVATDKPAVCGIAEWLRTHSQPV